MNPKEKAAAATPTASQNDQLQGNKNPSQDQIKKRGFLDYRGIGLCPIPVPLFEKFPVIKWAQYQKVLPSGEQCKIWQNTTSNLAFVTGSISGIFVIDVDGDVGAATLNRLVDEHGILPKTPVVKTSRGFHYYFRLPEGIKIKTMASHTPNGDLILGIDVRGEGGIIIAPPSIHKSGARYEWIISPWDCSFAEPPIWLLEMLTPRPFNPQVVLDLNKPIYSSKYAMAALQSASQNIAAAPLGTRNQTFNDEAWSVMRFVKSGELDMFDVIFSLVSAAASAGLESKEIESTLSSVLKGKGVA